MTTTFSDQHVIQEPQQVPEDPLDGLRQINEDVLAAMGRIDGLRRTQEEVAQRLRDEQEKLRELERQRTAILQRHLGNQPRRRRNQDGTPEGSIRRGRKPRSTAQP
jgi:membrane protein involved in colicin uptake